MSEHHVQLVINAAKVLGLNIKTHEDEHGSVIIQEQDKIDLFEGYKLLIAQQIGAKLDLINRIEKRYRFIPKFLLSHWRLIDEKLKAKRDLLDLEVEMLSKQDWIFHYKRHLEYHQSQRTELLKKAESELEGLMRDVSAIVGDKKAVTKDIAIFTGMLATFYRGFNSDSEVLSFYQSVKNRLELYATENKDKERAD